MTVEDKTQNTDARPLSDGRIVQVIGAVVDVEFPPDALPAINYALTTEAQNINSDSASGDAQWRKMTLEVAQHLGNDIVRCIAMAPTDGLVRGAVVKNTGAPITVPVGEATKGAYLMWWAIA